MRVNSMGKFLMFPAEYQIVSLLFWIKFLIQLREKENNLIALILEPEAPFRITEFFVF